MSDFLFLLFFPFNFFVSHSRYKHILFMMLFCFVFVVFFSLLENAEVGAPNNSDVYYTMICMHIACATLILVFHFTKKKKKTNETSTSLSSVLLHFFYFFSLIAYILFAPICDIFICI